MYIFEKEYSVLPNSVPWFYSSVLVFFRVNTSSLQDVGNDKAESFGV